MAGANATQPELLGLDDIPKYLLDQQLVRASTFLEDHSLDIQDRSRRNSNFAVLTKNEQPVLVKQPRVADAYKTLTTEAKILELLTLDHRFSVARKFVPQFRHFDAERRILAIELITPATTLLKLYNNGGEPAFPVEAAQAVGITMAEMHGALARAHAAGLLPFVGPRDPRAFNWEESALPQWDDLSAARKDLIQAIVDMAILDNRKEIIELLTARGTPCHNDPRWDNFVVTAGRHSRGLPVNLRMIDWETCALGDPAFDLAFFVSEYLRFWTQTTSFDDAEAKVVKAQHFEMSSTHASVSALLSTYSKRRKMAEGTARRFAARMVQFLPYCLTNAAVEMNQNATSVYPGSYVLLREAANIKNDPGQHLKRIFGMEA